MAAENISLNVIKSPFRISIISPTNPADTSYELRIEPSSVATQSTPGFQGGLRIEAFDDANPTHRIPFASSGHTYVTAIGEMQNAHTYTIYIHQHGGGELARIADVSNLGIGLLTLTPGGEAAFVGNNINNLPAPINNATNMNNH